MALSTIRRLATEDIERLAAAEARFIVRHNLDATLPLADQLARGYGESEIDTLNKAYLNRLWLACFRRAVRHPSAHTVGWGYLGWNAD